MLHKKYISRIKFVLQGSNKKVKDTSAMILLKGAFAKQTKTIKRLIIMGRNEGNAKKLDKLTQNIGFLLVGGRGWGGGGQVHIIMAGAAGI